MDTSIIFKFLGDIAANNSREWFQAHRAEYDAARASFEADIEKAIRRTATFDASVGHLTLKDVTYRFYRDTRFSPDKSPYKRHFGAYIAAHGKKAMHGGYYIHLEPGQSLLACGNYELPTRVLNACRNEIMGNIDTWRSIVEDGRFVHLFGYPGCGTWGESRGFGLTMLKKCPAGFPKDYPYIDYLRMKDYCCWHRVPDDFFADDSWTDRAADIFSTAKPMMDFVNDVIDDYE